MLKLRLEEIAIREAQRHLQSSPRQEGQEAKLFLIELDRKQIVHILLHRRDADRVNVYRGNPLIDVHHYEFKSPECTHTYLKIEDRSIPSRQGTFRFREDGTLIYQNECNHGTSLIPLNATQPNSRIIRGEYAPIPGDQFLLGFPGSSYRFKATILKS